MSNKKEIRDCHYCNYCCTNSPEDEHPDCYIEDYGYFDHHINNSIEEAKNCPYFDYSDVFPKY